MAVKRIVTISFLVVASAALFAASPAHAQAPAPVPTAHPYGLDPYTPSDAVWLRNFGSSLVAQTPLVELATTLDPYKPSDAALIRQFGGAIPLCCADWYWPGASLGPVTPLFPQGRVMSPAVQGPGSRFDFGTSPSRPDSAAPAPGATTTQPTPSSIVTLARPQDNNGVSIRFAGQTWTNAGRAIPLSSTGFQRVGEAGGVAVYRASGNSDLIYVQIRDNWIAPFRVRP